LACLQGYFRIRQTAEQLKKKKEAEREARRKDRDMEIDSTDKPKLDEHASEELREKEKVI
jgi:hypothetical protein